MRNLFKKLHIMSNNPSEDKDGSTSSRVGGRSRDGSPGKVSPSQSSSPSSSHHSEQKPLSGLSGWLNSVTNKKSPSPPSPSNSERGERRYALDSTSITGLDVVLDTTGRDSGSSTSRDPEIEEEYQIQLALELSAREDPEAVQIEAVKQISLGSCALQNTPAEVVAYRYWNYNSLSYDDKILDGFYDLYGILAESTSEKMPSLVDLQGTPVSEGISWEAVLVNRAADANLLKLEQNALVMAVESRSESLGFIARDLVRELAALVADYMGGPVGDPERMLRSWIDLSYGLRATIGSMVLPLGYLTIGLARHRALLFKVLADSVGIPCRLVKGQQYTGADDVAMNIVRFDDGREYIVDLMADPGTLIPSDAGGPQMDYEEPFSMVSAFSKDVDFADTGSASGDAQNFVDVYSESDKLDHKFESGSHVNTQNQLDAGGSLSELGYLENPLGNPPLKSLSDPNKSEVESKLCDDSTNLCKVKKMPTREPHGRINHPYSHARSPSWTEGVSSPAVRRMKVKDVSQYMIDAAKENPQLAQKLHDVLLESGVVAPPTLFTEMYTGELGPSAADDKKQNKDDAERKNKGGGRQVGRGPGHLVQPLPYRLVQSKEIPVKEKLEPLKPVEGLDMSLPQELEGIRMPSPQQSETSAASPQESYPANFIKHMPVAATAAVFASSMVVAAAKSSNDAKLEVPLAAVATATAAAMVATSAVVGRQYEHSDCGSQSPSNAPCFNQIGLLQNDSSEEVVVDPRGNQENDADSEAEKNSGKSGSNDSTKSDVAFDDVAELEIPWEEITLGERIGLGSYGEVYRGDWHGTEVAIKKFLDQDISGDALEEFRSEEEENKWLPVGMKLFLQYIWAFFVPYNAEWMAPEVLRNEPSNENVKKTCRCDVYSFGVILWELSTMQQPWNGMNPMQVVGAVGFQQRRLDIPDGMDPVIADIITKCWQTDPKLRPSFAEIMAALKPLQKPITSNQAPRPRPTASSSQRAGVSESTED
ncbi:hypothetical protein Scep_022953 [Stephania cephalantha]|uniref:Protein kinase domain-containing protein n=1 Tax=Stephania cephalantha TaxID=152367 RepID=A0AAP0I307_9MAGN